MEVTDRIRITLADEEDAKKLALISKRAFETDVEVGAPNIGGPHGYDALDFQSWAMSVMIYYRIHLDDALVGGLLVDTREGKHGVIERIFVEPENHRMGIGTRAMELLFEIHPEVKIWTLGTPEWNKRTKSFFDGLGFKQVGWDLRDSNWRSRWYQKVRGGGLYRFTPIGELIEGMNRVTVEGEVLEKGLPRTVRSRRRGNTLNVANAAIGDDTGRIVLVLWNEQIGHAKVGDNIRVENGYVNSFRGVTQINVGRAGKLITLI
jgi:predicted acetyltransferase